MEIKLLEGKTEIKPYKINYEDLKSTILATTAKYKNLVLTEDQIKEGKKERADLNKIEKDLKAFFTKTKKEHMKPLEELDSQIKELAGYVKEASGSIDSQIKNFEEQQKEAKHKELQYYFAGYELDITFDAFFEQQWLNASVSIKKAKEELDEKVRIYNSEIATIKSFNSKHELLMIDTYKQSGFSLQKAISANQRMIDLENAEEERRAKAEAEELERIEAEEKAKQAQKPVEVPSSEKEIKEPETLIDLIDSEPELFVRELRITGTREQLHALKAFLDTNNIKYEAI